MRETPRNNFDCLRLLAASLVVFSHCYKLAGRPEPLEALTHQFGAAGIGVTAFFIVSGYLIAGSWENSRSFPNYLKKRCLRIFPAFIVSVLVCALVIAPLVTVVPLHDYFRDGRTWKFLANINLYALSFHLPGVFETHPHTGINGVYWTLPLEFTCYLALALLGMLGWLRARGLMTAVAALVLLHMLTTIRTPPVFFMSPYFLTAYGAAFFGGALLYHCRKIFARPTLLHHACALASLGLAMALADSPFGRMTTALCLIYPVIYLAHAPLPLLRHAGRWGDFSYGIYLYGFPMQQLWVMTLGTEVAVLTLFLLSLASALACAALSWHFIEKPALTFK